MDFNKLNERIKEYIIAELGIDVTNSSRIRANVEARVLYCSIVRELTPWQTLDSIGKSIGRDHSTVIYCLKSYKSFCFYNNRLEDMKNKILREYLKNYSDYKIEDIDKEIQYHIERINKLNKAKEKLITKIQINAEQRTR